MPVLPALRPLFEALTQPAAPPRPAAPAAEARAAAHAMMERHILSCYPAPPPLRLLQEEGAAHYHSDAGRFHGWQPMAALIPDEAAAHQSRIAEALQRAWRAS